MHLNLEESCQWNHENNRSTLLCNALFCVTLWISTHTAINGKLWTRLLSNRIINVCYRWHGLEGAYLFNSILILFHFHFISLERNSILWIYRRWYSTFKHSAILFLACSGQFHQGLYITSIQLCLSSWRWMEIDSHCLE